MTHAVTAEARIYDRLLRALLNGALPAGTPLREEALASLFRVTRGRIRKILARLGHEGRLELIPNRGAFVPRPSADEWERVFEARRVLEAGILATLARTARPRDLRQLSEHVVRERRAAGAGRRHESVKLSAGFHTLLAELVGSAPIADFLQRLVLPTQLVVSLYEPRRHSHCAPDEHARIVAALAARDPGRAILVMTDHLAAVESRLAIPRQRTARVDLRAALGAQK
jgi:DNA-binding GntR family transcriptional regulator